MRPLLLAIFLIPTLTYSEEAVKVSSGMSMQEVIKLMGPATSKEEFEASRKIIWHYPQEKVLFYEGRVFSNVVAASENEPISEKPAATAFKEESTLTREPKKPRSEEVDTLLKEIMRESTSTGDAPSPAGSAPGINPGFQASPPLIGSADMDKE